MATFKVGQRVRIKQHPNCRPEYVGREAVFGGYDSHWADTKWDCFVIVDGREAWGPSDGLVPLAPPASDAWAAEKVKQLTKPTYTEPVIEKETA